MLVKTISSTPYIPKIYNDPTPSYIASYRIRNSLRWIGGNRHFIANCPLPLPYIDELGHILYKTCVLWNTRPERIISTIISTRIDRVMTRYSQKYGIRKCLEREGELVACATISTFFSNNIFENIFHHIFKHPKKAKRVMKYLYTQLDINTRFVVNHVLKNTKWFNIRKESSPCRLSNYIHSSPKNIFDLSKISYGECVSIEQYTEHILCGLHRVLNSNHVNYFRYVPKVVYVDRKLLSILLTHK